MTRDRSAPLDRFGGFLAVECPQAGDMAWRLAEEASRSTLAGATSGSGRPPTSRTPSSTRP